MRAATRLLASVQRSTQYLEPGAPTGITGLFTHPTPRSTLLYYYNSTLEKLKLFPEHSVYRQSTEALTKQRMGIVESVKPAGLDEWQKRVADVVASNPVAFRKIPALSGDGFNVVYKEGVVEKDEHQQVMDDYRAPPIFEGPLTAEERKDQGKLLEEDKFADAALKPHIESEPSLTAEQVNEIETKIGAGLIEEVIQVAEGESKLVDVLLGSKAWEDLEEKPQGNQWTYHERDTHTGKTQAP